MSRPARDAKATITNLPILDPAELDAISQTLKGMILSWLKSVLGQKSLLGSPPPVEELVFAVLQKRMERHTLTQAGVRKAAKSLAARLISENDERRGRGLSRLTEDEAIDFLRRKILAVEMNSRLGIGP